MDRHVVSLDSRSALQEARTGGKGAGLARLRRNGLNVPPGFVITSAAFHTFLTDLGIEVLTQRKDWTQGDLDRIRELLHACRIPDRLSRPIQAACRKLEGDFAGAMEVTPMALGIKKIRQSIRAPSGRALDGRRSVVTQAPQRHEPSVAPVPRQPIVILGGFLSFSMLYIGMRDVLTQLTELPVWIVEMQSMDWLPSIVPPGWIHLLRKLDDTVRPAARQSDTGKVTLVGHSAGGVLARIYLSPRPLLGHAYRGLDYVDHLITLGSPHNVKRWSLHGGRMSRWAEKRYHGAFFAPRVSYVSVAGRLIRGNRQGSLRERHAYSFYEELAGDGNVWGDGLVPVASALLHGAQQIVLDGVSHFTGFGGPWYGAAEIIPQWLSGDSELDFLNPTHTGHV